jgi:hypothetical protein
VLTWRRGPLFLVKPLLFVRDLKAPSVELRVHRFSFKAAHTLQFKYMLGTVQKWVSIDKKISILKYFALDVALFRNGALPIFQIRFKNRTDIGQSFHLTVSYTNSILESTRLITIITYCRVYFRYLSSLKSTGTS